MEEPRARHSVRGSLADTPFQHQIRHRRRTRIANGVMLERGVIDQVPAPRVLGRRAIQLRPVAYDEIGLTIQDNENLFLRMGMRKVRRLPRAQESTCGT